MRCRRWAQLEKRWLEQQLWNRQQKEQRLRWHRCHPRSSWEQRSPSPAAAAVAKSSGADCALIEQGIGLVTWMVRTGGGWTGPACGLPDAAVWPR